MRLRQLVSTIGHLLPGQVINRPLRVARRAVARPIRPPRRLTAEISPRLPFPAHPALVGSPPTFEFLNRKVSLTPPVDWDARDAPALWRYNLNYFNYLGAVEHDEREALCLDWMRHNKPFKGVGWDAYPTSLRIINWVKYAPRTDVILTSLYVHADYLSRNVETHLLGNHLLENARALVFAGVYFDGQPDAERWLNLGLRIYQKQLPEQVLNDGGHFERSPMYHALMLEGCADVANLLPVDHTAAPMFREVATRMGTFIEAMLHPDGEISLFNDSVFGVAPNPLELMRYVRNVTGSTDGGNGNSPVPGLIAFPQTGYFVFRGLRLFVVIDGGPVGPDYLPAHAHADVFSYELSRGRQRWIVDSGVYEYARGEMRSYCRSTRAHSTVEVDDADQIEVYSSFRVGRRARPYGVTFRGVDGGFEFGGTFPGYRILIGDDVRVVRTIHGTEDRLIVTDRAEGRGAHRLRSYLHLHPQVRVEPVSETTVRLSTDSEHCLLTSSGPAVLIEKGWYCPRFGVREENIVLVLSIDSNLPAETRYALNFDES